MRRRVDGQSYKLGLIAAGPKSSGSFEWVNKPFKVWPFANCHSPSSDDTQWDL